MTSKYFRCSKLNYTRMERTAKKRKNSPEDGKDAKNGKSGKQIIPSPESSTAMPSQSSEPDCKAGVPKRLGQVFFDIQCANLARKLLGQHIVRSIGTQRIKGRIVETEAYQGEEDKAAHSYKGKKTPRNEAMFMTPGTSYVYNIYGMYCCLNISSQGDGAAVLIRALEPVEGQDLMQEGRRQKKNENKKPLKEKDLTNGPSKLCQALHISKNDFNKVDLTSCDSMWLESGDSVDDSAIVCCPRINIGYADDWKDKPLRFYVLGNSSVSVKDKKAELLLKSESIGEAKDKGGKKRRKL